MPIPFQDGGEYRCFAVKNEHAAKVVTTILGKFGDFSEGFNFDTSPTYRVMHCSNRTIVIRNGILEQQGLAPNYLCVVVKDPSVRAHEIATMLEQAGFTAIMKEDNAESTIWLASNAFDGWMLSFRHHTPSPNKKKLLG